MRETTPEEDYLMAFCDRFMECLADPNSADRRNTYFNIIWTIVKQKVKADMAIGKESPYPLLSEFVPKEQWDNEPTVTSSQQKDFVSKIMDVIEAKNNGNIKGDTFR